MKCYYCNSENVEPIATNTVSGKVYAIQCLDNKDGFCKCTSIPQMENCRLCNKEFEFLFDPGGNENIVCLPCQLKAMKEYFDDPEVKAALQEAIKHPSPFLKNLENDDSWQGGYIPVPFNLSK